MNVLYLGNTDTVAMAPSAEKLSDHFLQKAATSAKRMVWMADCNDTIVTSTAISRSFLEYAARMKGNEGLANSMSLMQATHPRPLPIKESDITEKRQLADFLSTLASEGSIKVVHPYIADETANAFAKLAGAESVSFGADKVAARSLVTRHLNDKSKFREFACLLGIPIAIGAICVDAKALQEAVRSALTLTGSVILKMARHSSGEGNVLLHSQGNSSSLGAATAIHVGGMSESALTDAIIETRLTPSHSDPVVVEAYYENETSLGLHYDISAKAATLLGAAEILNSPTVGGQYWSADVLDRVPLEVLAWCQQLADYSQTIGHVGPLSVDIIKGRSVGYIATEVNGRHGGFSTVRALAKSVGLGTEVEGGSRVVLVHHGLGINLSFPEALAKLEECSLHYESATRRGVVIMTEGYMDNGPYDLVIVGRDRSDVVGIEADLLRLSSMLE